ncbi:MAG: hypothetical protein FJW83_07675 [Actinobacteria bacterium]|nr:hypothetical protein [Actinomycetota bacterium]
MRTLREVPHLARRFVDAFRRSEPSEADTLWAAGIAGPAAALWEAQSVQDRRHTIAVARAVEGSDPPRWVLEAALLHDVGKAEAALGPLGRSLATVLEILGVGSAPGALGRYLTYPRRGAELLAAVGSDPLVVRWAAEHHEDPERWTVPRAWAERLVAADRTAR